MHHMTPHDPHKSDDTITTDEEYITEVKRRIYKRLKDWNFHVRAEICRKGVGRRGAVVPRR